MWNHSFVENERPTFKSKVMFLTVDLKNKQMEECKNCFCFI